MRVGSCFRPSGPYCLSPPNELGISGPCQRSGPMIYLFIKYTCNHLALSSHPCFNLVSLVTFPLQFRRGCCRWVAPLGIIHIRAWTAVSPLAAPELAFWSSLPCLGKGESASERAVWGASGGLASSGPGHVLSGIRWVGASPWEWTLPPFLPRRPLAGSLGGVLMPQIWRGAARAHGRADYNLAPYMFLSKQMTEIGLGPNRTLLNPLNGM